MSNKSGSLGIHSKVVKTETLKEDLFELLSFDQDESGANGEEYLINTARKKGFTNNLSFWIDSAVEHSNDKDVKAIILNVLDHFTSDYWDTKVSVIKIDNHTSYCAVAFAS